MYQLIDRGTFSLTASTECLEEKGTGIFFKIFSVSTSVDSLVPVASKTERHIRSYLSCLMSPQLTSLVSQMKVHTYVHT